MVGPAIRSVTVGVCQASVCDGGHGSGSDWFRLSGWSAGGLVRKLTLRGGSEVLDCARTGALKGKDAQEAWKNIKLWQWCQMDGGAEWGWGGGKKNKAEGLARDAQSLGRDQESPGTVSRDKQLQRGPHLGGKVVGGQFALVCGSAGGGHKRNL